MPESASPGGIPPEPAPLEPPTVWELKADPVFLRQEGIPGPVRQTGMYFKPVLYVLINRGVYDARDIEIVLTDPKAQFEGKRSWARIGVAQAVNFTATRRLITDNSFRLQWFQGDDTKRYWQTMYLPNLGDDPRY